MSSSETSTRRERETLVLWRRGCVGWGRGALLAFAFSFASTTTTTSGSTVGTLSRAAASATCSRGRSVAGAKLVDGCQRAGKDFLDFHQVFGCVIGAC